MRHLSYLSTGLVRLARQHHNIKILVKQSSLNDDPFDNGNDTDDLIKDMDGIKSDADEDPLPPTPPRPSTPTVPQQRLLPWKPKVRYIHVSSFYFVDA